MSVITIPVDAEIESFINRQIDLKNYESKADLVRLALRKFIEEKEVEEILKASQEIRDGKGLKGDLDTLAKMFD